MKNCIVISLLLTMAGCASTNKISDFQSFSKALYKIQKSKQGCSFYPKLSFDLRNKLSNGFDFIDYNRDTIYLLEAFSISDGTLYYAIWNRKSKVEYKGVNSKIKMDSSLFIRRIYEMIENWEVSSIRKEGKEHGIIDGMTMIGSRVILDKSKIDADCISFKEFFDLEKDR